MRWPKQTWIPVPVAEAQTARHPNCKGIVGQTGGERNPQGTNLRGVTTHCIEITHSKGSACHGNGKTGAHSHGQVNTRGADGALDWSHNQ